MNLGKKWELLKPKSLNVELDGGEEGRRDIQVLEIKEQGMRGNLEEGIKNLKAYSRHFRIYSIT